MPVITTAASLSANGFGKNQGTNLTQDWCLSGFSAGTFSLEGHNVIVHNDFVYTIIFLSDSYNFTKRTKEGVTIWTKNVAMTTPYPVVTAGVTSTALVVMGDYLYSVFLFNVVTSSIPYYLVESVAVCIKFDFDGTSIWTKQYDAASTYVVVGGITTVLGITPDITNNRLFYAFEERVFCLDTNGNLLRGGNDVNNTWTGTFQLQLITSGTYAGNLLANTGNGYAIFTVDSNGDFISNIAYNGYGYGLVDGSTTYAFGGTSGIVLDLDTHTITSARTYNRTSGFNYPDYDYTSAMTDDYFYVAIYPENFTEIILRFNKTSLLNDSVKQLYNSSVNIYRSRQIVPFESTGYELVVNTRQIWSLHNDSTIAGDGVYNIPDIDGTYYLTAEPLLTASTVTRPNPTLSFLNDPYLVTVNAYSYTVTITDTTYSTVIRTGLS